ncbi:SEP-domain-containing protein [Hymenopellis radicata]|nr:SEP-domain-containing protein [Hymenopellis radicata]
MSDPNDTNAHGFSLSGGPAEPLPESWARPSTTRRELFWGGSGPRIASLRDLSGPSAPAPPPSFGGGGHDSDDEDDQPRGAESWFAGGERSGISVQNPDHGRGNVPGGNMVRDLLRRAAEAGPALPPASGSSGSGAFAGGGHTLGSDDIESSYIPDPNAPEDPEQETAIRHLTFWRDGFTVEDGELMRYDDPNNETILAEINSGRAPPSILNVLPGQPVELRVDRQIDQDYVAPKRSGFFGSGNRLGAPVPGEAASSSSMPGGFSAASSAPAASSPAAPSGTKFEVDQSLPTTSIQIRLADGTRMVCRMNLTHTVLDIRNFINASRPENLTRPYTIGTTFPNKTLEDNTQTVEAAGLKNSVIVQRWA